MLKSLNFKHKEDTTKIITLTSTTTQWFQMQQFSFWIDLKFLKTLFLLNRKKMNINIYGLHHLNLKELSTVYQLKCQIKHLHHNNRPPAANPHIQFTHFKSRRSNKQIYNNNQTENSTQQQQTKRKNASLRQSITTSNFLILAQQNQDNNSNFKHKEQQKTKRTTK